MRLLGTFGIWRQWLWFLLQVSHHDDTNLGRQDNATQTSVDGFYTPGSTM